MRNKVSVVSLCRTQMSDIFRPTACSIIYKYNYVYEKEKFKADWTKIFENISIRISFEL